MNCYTLRTRALGLLLWCVAAAPAWAYLGSFQPADGYHVQSGTILGDVSLYNAGQYGANAGGGPGPTQIAADSGLWKLLSPVGGYFGTVADRNAAVAGGPPYPPTPPNTIPAYIVGNHTSGRNLDGSNLALRNDTPIGTGPMIYEYSLDSFDFGGPAPTSITSGPVLTEFYFCPNPGDTPNPGSVPGDKFTMSFKDSLGNVGLQWGYARDNSVYWRTSPSNNWTPTAFVADQTNWDGLRVDIDLSADTFGIDYFDVSANTWTNIVPTGTALGQALQDLSVLRWQLEDGLFAGVGGKNFFDDFSFTVPIPEPSAIALIGFMACGFGAVALRRRLG